MAMIGGITLRGDALPVRNEKDNMAIPEHIRKDVLFPSPHTTREVLEIVMEQSEARS
jgi:ATP-dependent Lon protease